jgi:hypothetical protein
MRSSSQGFPRRLTPREADVRRYLLSVDFPGRDELVAQSRAVEVVGRWDDGPTIELRVSTDAPRAEVEYLTPVEASTADGLLNVILFVRDGLLSLIELVVFDGPTPAELPAPEELDEPIALPSGDDV